MTDTSRPKVEAPKAQLEHEASGRGVHFDTAYEAGNVLGALLTERDELTQYGHNLNRAWLWKWNEVCDERDAARAQIAKIGGYAALDNSTLGSLIRAILRGAQEATEPSEPWQDPEPWVSVSGVRHPMANCAFPGVCVEKPRSRAVYDSETKGPNT